MVRACRQPLTSSSEEMDAFTLVMLAIELERKKRAEHDALKTQQSNSHKIIKSVVPLPSILRRNEGQLPDTQKSQIVP